MKRQPNIILDNDVEKMRATIDHKYSIYYSDNFFKSENLLRAGGSRFAITNHYLFVAHISNKNSSEVRLEVSDLVVNEYQLKPVQLPFALLKEHSYTILESREQRVFMHVTHSVSGLSYGHVYVSDSRGNKFDLSLEYNVKNQFGYCDFDRVDGLPNFYIANYYEEESLRLARFQLQYSLRSNDRNNDVSDFLIKKTKITFNKGRDWQNLSPPKSRL